MQRLFKFTLLFILLASPCIAQPKNREFPVGTIISSLLNTANFQRLMGEEWRVMDGTSISGTHLASLYGGDNLPDARGKFLRMANDKAKCTGNKNSCQYNVDNTPVGKYQSDSLKSHTHSHTDTVPAGRGWGLENHSGNGSFKGASRSTGASGGSETRPKSITVNQYVKVDKCQSANCQ